MDDALKTRGTKYLNIDTWLLFAHLSKFLATRLPLPSANSKMNKERVTEFLYQTVELPTSVRFLQKTRAWSRS